MSFRGAEPIGSIRDVGISGFAVDLKALTEIATSATTPIGAPPRNDSVKINDLYYIELIPNSFSNLLERHNHLEDLGNSLRAVNGQESNEVNPVGDRVPLHIFEIPTHDCISIYY
jgi:hypothetical protein